MATGERGGRDVPAALNEYVEALPVGAPPARDWQRSADRRKRLVPHLRAHAAREHVRARRRRAVRRAALLMSAVGGAAVMVLVAMNGRLFPGHARPGATIAVLDGTLWLDEG
jgi:hypothetical protein